MLTWIRDYLTRRCARFKANNTISNLVHLHEGVPQGGILSPTLYINDLHLLFSPYIHRTLHADDLAIWTVAETIGTAQTRMQNAISKVEQWAKDWDVTISESKTASMLFSLSTKTEQFRLKVNGHDIPASSTIKYLGVTFDQRLTWSKHILDISPRATLRIRILKKLAGTQWGANLKTLKQVYIGNVRPVPEYGFSTFGTAASTTLQKLDKIQNTGLRIISGDMTSTPINEMESRAGLNSLEEQREEKIVLQAEQYKRLQRHPMHQKCLSSAAIASNAQALRKQQNKCVQNTLISCPKERVKYNLSMLPDLAEFISKSLTSVQKFQRYKNMKKLVK